MERRRLANNIELLTLHEFSLILNSTRNIKEIVNLSAQKITEITRSEGCHVLFSRSISEGLKLETATLYGKKSFPVGVDETKGVSGTTFETGEIIVVEDAETDPRVNKVIQRHLGHRSMLSVPVQVRGRTIGVIVVYSDEPAKYTERDGRFLMMLGSHLGLAVENANLLVELERTSKTSFQASLLDQVRNGVVATDLSGRIIYWNKFAEKLYQWSSKEVIGQHIGWVLVLPEERTRINKRISEVIQKGFWEGELTYLKKDGSLILVQTMITLIKDDAGRPIGLVSVQIDVTEKKEVEKRIARLDKLNLVGEMAAGIGHEVRNPLTSIRGFLQLLSQQKKYQDASEYFRLMIDEVDRANAIITEYLSLAKNKKVSLKMESINRIVERLLPLLNADASMAEVSVVSDLVEMPDILLDSNEITQLIINLVRNGVEATPKGRVVEIKTWPEECGAVLSVRDEGDGIAPEVLEKMGTPFVTTKDGGIGLGLAVCYSIAARHNAQIHVETGKTGTTFLVRFNEA